MPAHLCPFCPTLRRERDEYRDLADNQRQRIGDLLQQLSDMTEDRDVWRAATSYVRNPHLVDRLREATANIEQVLAALRRVAP